MRIAIRSALLGRLGEWRAAWFYRLRGYRIVGRNVRLRSGEIDLLARRGSTLAVVEVKTRQSMAFGQGYDAVDSRKRMRLVRLADEYLVRERRPLQIRYDVMSLFWNGWRFEVRCFADAFRPVSDPREPWKWRA